MRRVSVVAALIAVVCGCTDDFNQFHAVGRGGTGTAGNGVTGGITGGGSGGSTGGVTSGGTGGASGGASGAPSSGGVGGVGGAGGTCASTLTLCSGTCVDTNASDGDCGSCGNSCVLQGKAAGFRCVTGLCRCTSLEQCRGDGGTSGIVFCRSTANGRCACTTSSNICNYGEICSSLGGTQQVCSCNGGSACFPGWTCCYAPSGCKDLQNDAENCGACGRACPSGSPCQSGQCQ